MGRSIAALLLLAGVLAFALLPRQTATASCAAPQLGIDAAGDPPIVKAGREFTVEGRHFVEGCDDNGGSDMFGCEEEDAETETPMADVDLVLIQRGREWVLDTASAGSAADNKLGQVTWSVVIPNDVWSGNARLKTSSSPPLRIYINTPVDAQ